METCSMKFEELNNKPINPIDGAWSQTVDATASMVLNNLLAFLLRLGVFDKFNPGLIK